MCSMNFLSLSISVLWLRTVSMCQHFFFFCSQEFLQIDITLSEWYLSTVQFASSKSDTYKLRAKLGLPSGSKAGCELSKTSRKTVLKKYLVLILNAKTNYHCIIYKIFFLTAVNDHTFS